MIFSNSELYRVTPVLNNLPLPTRSSPNFLTRHPRLSQSHFKFLFLASYLAMKPYFSGPSLKLPVFTLFPFFHPECPLFIFHLEKSPLLPLSQWFLATRSFAPRDPLALTGAVSGCHKMTACVLLVKAIMLLNILNWSFSRVQFFMTPWTVACQAPLSILLARIPEWVAISSSRGSSRPRGRTHVSCTGGGLSTTEIAGTRQPRMSPPRLRLRKPALSLSRQVPGISVPFLSCPRSQLCGRQFDGDESISLPGPELRECRDYVLISVTTG